MLKFKERAVDRERDLAQRLTPRIRRRGDGLVALGAFLAFVAPESSEVVTLLGYGAVLAGIALSLKSRDVAWWFATA